MSDNVTIVKTKPDTRRSKAYAKAGVALRQAHREEFNKYYAAACVELGMEYKPRRSKDDREREAAEKKLAKAQATVAKLVAAHGEDVLPFEDSIV